MAPDWDEDSPRLRRSAKERTPPSLEEARGWQRRFMEGLEPDDEKYVGSFHGEPGLENIQVAIGPHYGVALNSVAEELREFEVKLQATVAWFDEVIPVGSRPSTADQLKAVIDLCAWTHSEWVRIHPFVNGNGRTARLWANSIASRYGLPRFVRLRPSPTGDYRAAGAQAMQGNWKPTAKVFHKMCTI